MMPFGRWETPGGQRWRDHPGLYAATDRYPCAGDSELEEAVDQIVSTLGQSLQAYDLSSEAVVHAGRVLRSAFHGFSHLEAGEGYPLDHDLDRSFDDLLTVLCRGVRAMARDSDTVATGC